MLGEFLAHLAGILRTFAAPTVIVAIASTLVGSVLAYLGIRLNRMKEAFETHRYARSLFNELFDLNGRTDDKLAEFKTIFATTFPSSSFPEASSTRELLLKIDEAIQAKEHPTSAVELREFVSRVSAVHYSTQAKRTLLVHALAELLERHGELLNNFEKYAAFHAVLVTQDHGLVARERWLHDARMFYADAMRHRDYSAVVRMGMTLVGVEVGNGLLDEASRRLAEIESDVVVKGSGLEPVFLKRRFRHLRETMTRKADHPGVDDTLHCEEHGVVPSALSNKRIEPPR